MMDRLEAILAAFVAALNAPTYTVGGVTHTRPAGLTVVDHDLEGVELEDLPAAGVYPLEEDAERVTVQPSALDLVVTVGVELRAAGTPRHTVLAPLRTWALVAVHNHPELRALLRDFPAYAQGRWDASMTSMEARISDVATLALGFRCRYRTSYGDPTQPGAGQS